MENLILQAIINSSEFITIRIRRFKEGSIEIKIDLLRHESYLKRGGHGPK